LPDNKYVYFFGKDKTEGNATMRNLLGGKGSHLAEMANLGIPVPPGFTITTNNKSVYRILREPAAVSRWSGRTGCTAAY